MIATRPPGDQARGALAWLAIVAPMWLVLALCTSWEPIRHDGWGHYLWHRYHDNTFAELYEITRSGYVHNNPRLGQLLTLLLYTPGGWHVAVTPVVELALFYLATTLALGRWPSWRRADDALVFATIVAMTAACAPRFGAMLFYRPYTGNYVYGLVSCLALLVPFRFAIERATRARGTPWHALWQVPIALVAGAAAGLANEHTSPTVAALAIAATVIVARRRGRPPAWMIAGALGVVAGGIALLVAPGQDIRYSGLATQDSLVGRVFGHGALETAQIVLLPYVMTVPAAAWIALARVRARAPSPGDVRFPIVAALASLAVVVTLLASPKHGPRLYFAAQVFAIVGMAAWVMPRVDTPRRRTLAAALAAIVLAIAGWRCVHCYRTLGDEFAARLEALEGAPPGTVVRLPRYSIDPPAISLDGRFWLGEDLDPPLIRAHLANGLHLADIVLVAR